MLPTVGGDARSGAGGSSSPGNRKVQPWGAQLWKPTACQEGHSPGLNGISPDSSKGMERKTPQMSLVLPPFAGGMLTPPDRSWLHLRTHHGCNGLCRSQSTTSRLESSGNTWGNPPAASPGVPGSPSPSRSDMPSQGSQQRGNHCPRSPRAAHAEQVGWSRQGPGTDGTPARATAP